MKVKNFVIFLAMFLCSANLFAQQKTISGKVTDSSGEAVIGASVTTKDGKKGVVTNVDGDYALTVSGDEKVLVFKSVGKTPQEVTISGNKMNVKLEDDQKILNEVVVIGYGTTKRKDITGSVATVKSDVLETIPVASVAEAISGKLAGVQVTTTEGSPDAEIKVRVRGGGSITGDNKPLYIVDGFPVPSINDIPSSDIEDITVLKDASSTAIYGSRGANGVILVTTKSGKAGKLSVNYNAYFGVKKIAKKLDVLPAPDYVKWQYELALLNNNNTATSYEKYFGIYDDMDLYNNAPANDWQEIIFGRTGNTFNHSISLNGGSEAIKYAFNYNHINDKAIMQMSNFRRDNLSMKLNNKPMKAISIDFSARYANTVINGGGMNEQNEKSSTDARLKNAIIYTPVPIKNLESNVDLTDESDLGSLYDPLVSITDNDRQQKRQTINMAGALTWEMIKNLKLKTEVGFDDYRQSDNRFYGKTTYYAQTASAGLPIVTMMNANKQTIRNTNTLNYDFEKLLPDAHKLNLLLGEEYILTKSNDMGSVITNFPDFFDSNKAFKLTTQGLASSINNYYYPDDILLSFFGRANYNLLDKYLLSATLRADGSSKFSSGNKWGYFPSAALAWRISSEPFMESTKKWMDDLKLRFSYGTAGNNNIPMGQTMQSYKSITSKYLNNFTSVWVPDNVMANPELRWETTVTRNIGLDFSLLNSKLSGSLETYLNTTTDLLINFPVPGSGYLTQYRNMGETQNKGVEATLNWVVLSSKNYDFSVNANIGFNKNKINSLGIMNDFGAASNWASTEIISDYWVAKGGSVGQMYGYLSDGRYTVADFDRYDAATKKWILKSGVVDASPVVGALRPGSMKLKDINGNDNTVNISDRTIIGDANPIHTGGLSLNGRVFNVDISANFNWSYGNKIYNANKIEYTSTSKYQYRNMITLMADGKRWTNLKADGTISNDPVELEAMNVNTTLWSPYMKQFVFTDWAVENGSFLRLNTLTFGYTMPNKTVKNLKIQKLRFYATAYNVVCFTNYSGFDPEVSTRRKTNLTPGVDYSAYPKSRQLVFGLNLSF